MYRWYRLKNPTQDLCVWLCIIDRYAYLEMSPNHLFSCNVDVNLFSFNEFSVDLVDHGNRTFAGHLVDHQHLVWCDGWLGLLMGHYVFQSRHSCTFKSGVYITSASLITSSDRCNPFIYHYSFLMLDLSPFHNYTRVWNCTDPWDWCS